jgi:hypothetical protein
MTQLKLTLAVALLLATGVSKADDRYDSAEEESESKGYEFVLQDRSKLEDEKNPQVTVTKYHLKTMPESLKETFKTVVIEKKASKEEQEKANKLFIETIPALAKTDKTIKLVDTIVIDRDSLDSERMSATPANWGWRRGFYGGGYGRGYGYGYGGGFGYGGGYSCGGFGYGGGYGCGGYGYGGGYGCGGYGYGGGYGCGGCYGYGAGYAVGYANVYSYGVYGGYGYAPVGVGYYGYAGYGCGWGY